MIFFLMVVMMDVKNSIYLTSFKSSLVCSVCVCVCVCVYVCVCVRLSKAVSW